jgi:two-component system, cell cycle response regulator
MRRSGGDARRGAIRSDRVVALEAENRKLQDELDALTGEVTRNDSLLKKTQERELELLRASTLTQLIDRVINGLRDSYQLDAVTLAIHDPQHDIRHLLWGEAPTLDHQVEVQFVDSLPAFAPQLASLDKPWLGPYSATDHTTLFADHREFGSLALIPLRRGEELDGVMVFASSDPFRFTRELASDFLAHLGMVAAICLENAVNRARLTRSGFTDFLTGFHNRRYLHARLREELARAQRFKRSIACLMIDLDNFKPINDRHGHLAGDAVLREVARRIDSEMRMSDTGARFGGDEFAIVLPQGGLQDGERLAARVLERVRSEPIAITADAAETVTLSIGVAVAEPTAGLRDFKLLAEKLIAEADAALYQSKQAGRNRVSSSANVVT